MPRQACQTTSELPPLPATAGGRLRGEHAAPPCYPPGTHACRQANCLNMQWLTAARLDMIHTSNANHPLVSAYGGAPVRRDRAARNWRSEARAKERGTEPPPANGAGFAGAEGVGHENAAAFL